MFRVGRCSLYIGLFTAKIRRGDGSNRSHGRCSLYRGVHEGRLYCIRRTSRSTYTYSCWKNSLTVLTFVIFDTDFFYRGVRSTSCLNKNTVNHICISYRRIYRVLIFNTIYPLQVGVRKLPSTVDSLMIFMVSFLYDLHFMGSSKGNHAKRISFATMFRINSHVNSVKPVHS